MEYYQYLSPPNLSGEHRRMLFEESGLDPGVVYERGYYTATGGQDVPQDRGKLRKKPGLVAPMYSPDGTTRSYQLRPNRKGKGPKYWSPGGRRMLVDVHPRMLDEVRHGNGPILITEGVKTGDAATSRGIPTLVLAGVNMWNVPKVKPKRLRSCFDHVRLEGRLVYVCFDSACMTKEGVQGALAELVAALNARSAVVKVIHLPDAADGSKQGVDDYLAGNPGGTIKEMFMLAREFAPADIGEIRMSRDKKFRAAVEDLERRFWAEEWKGMGGYTDRDVASKLMEAAGRRGKVVEAGIRVEISWGTLELELGVSRRTLWKAIRRLEDGGFCRRDSSGRKAGKAGAFVLRASVNQGGGAIAGGVESNTRVTKPASGGIHLRASVHARLERGGELGETVRVLPMPERTSGGLQLRTPRLRWSSPARRPRLGTVWGTRKVRQGQREKPRSAVKRLGKARGAVLDVVDDLGVGATFGEIASSLHHKRPRDLRRRHLPMLEEASILTVDDGLVTLAHDREAEITARRNIVRALPGGAA